MKEGFEMTKKVEIKLMHQNLGEVLIVTDCFQSLSKNPGLHKEISTAVSRHGQGLVLSTSFKQMLC